MTAHAPPIRTDALVIGAGPVGLFQVFQLGLQDIHAQVVDALPMVGGQCMALYPDKPIYDIPGLPMCTGRELVERLQQQAAPFKPQFHLNQQVSALSAHTDGGWLLSTSAGQQFISRMVFIAAGVGAFMPRQLALPELQAYEGTQVLHHVPDSLALKDQHLVVVGSDDAAVQAVLDSQNHSPASVTLVHRRASLDASAPLQTAFREACDSGQVRFQVGQVQGLDASAGCLSSLHIATPEGASLPLPCDQLWVLLGLTPQLGPLADWGLDMAKKQLNVNTENFATSAPGIFAVGDINHYPGKRKLILSGFHEATLAAFGAAAYLNPGQKIPLEYTTASPRLHKLLGV
jgi:thioredoxin reductase (NADPH)